MKAILILIALFISTLTFGQQLLSEKDQTEIRARLFKQQDAWNDGNVDQFMQTYWKSDQLVFIGASGVTHGWQKVCDNYKKHYPDKTNMGKLTFTILEMSRIDKNTAFVIGKYYQERTIGDLKGTFSLVWKKIKGEWVIVSDHSSAEK